MAREAARQPMSAIRLDRLLGRKVYTVDNRPVGRLEEFRAERREGRVITSYVIGAGGLAERLGIGVRLVLGLKLPGAYVARWNQLVCPFPIARPSCAR